MELQQIYYATVMDNIHKDTFGTILKDGKIQIKIEELHYECDSNLLPWARPFLLSTGGSDKSGVSNIPEINSKLWVFFIDENDGAFRKPFYIADGSLDDFNPHSLFNDNVKSNIGSSATYPNAKYYYFKNGICLGVDSSTTNPEIFIYHPIGTSMIIKNTGFFKFKDIVNTIESSALGITINNNLQVLI